MSICLGQMTPIQNPSWNYRAKGNRMGWHWMTIDGTLLFILTDWERHFHSVCWPFPSFSAASSGRIMNMLDCVGSYFIGCCAITTWPNYQVVVVCCLGYIFSSVCLSRFQSPCWLTVCSCPCFFLWAWWSSFPLFWIYYVLFPFSSCLSPSLSHAEAHSHLHPCTHPIPPPHSSWVVSLCPLHGFVLWPQYQGPGDEVTLHGRAAGLTKSPPSPLDTRQTVLRSTSPSALHFFLSYRFRHLTVQYRSFSSQTQTTAGKYGSFFYSPAFQLVSFHLFCPPMSGFSILYTSVFVHSVI